MSDPNFAHEFSPNRNGLCKTIVSGCHCHKNENDIVHVRWEQHVNDPYKEALDDSEFMAWWTKYMPLWECEHIGDTIIAYAAYLSGKRSISQSTEH